MWVLNGLLSAAFTGGRAVFDKHLIGPQDIPLPILLCMTYLCASLLTLPIAYFMGEHIALFEWSFLFPLMINVLCNVIAGVIYLKMLRRYDASLFMGIQSIEPIFVTVSAFIFVGETVSYFGLIGIFIVVIGGIFLQKSRSTEDLQSLFFHSPWIVMLIYMSLTSTATAFSKLALLHGDVFIYLGARYFILGVIFLCVVILLQRLGKLKPYVFHWHHLGSGLLLTGSTIFEMLALESAKVAYVETVRRLSLFFTLIFERIFVKTDWNRMRLFACLLLFTGAACVILLG